MSLEKTTIALERARAVHELQIQQPVAVVNDSRRLGSAYPVEFLDEAAWKKLQKNQPILLLSGARTKLLDLKSSALEAGKLSLKELWELTAGEPGKLKIAQTTSPAFAPALITLAKQAGLIPALLWSPEAPQGLFELPLNALADATPVEVIKGETVSLPVDGAEDATLTSFRTRYGSGVHLALTIGKIKKDTLPLVRVHSSCVTGDLLGSLRCDCGGQLQRAMEMMKEETAGILLYLYQEGRDIGITSKLRAYALQERGLDTFDANRQLGFEEDERDFSVATSILKSMSQTRIRLLTNNPDKVMAFQNSGIEIIQRLSLRAGESAHNQRYLDAKHKHGHFS